LHATRRVGTDVYGEDSQKHCRLLSFTDWDNCPSPKHSPATVQETVTAAAEEDWVVTARPRSPSDTGASRLSAESP